jgi:uncharacterized protein YlxW (UPF0749 family)
MSGPAMNDDKQPDNKQPDGTTDRSAAPALPTAGHRPPHTTETPIRTGVEMSEPDEGPTVETAKPQVVPPDSAAETISPDGVADTVSPESAQSWFAEPATIQPRPAEREAAQQEGPLGVTADPGAPGDESIDPDGPTRRLWSAKAPEELSAPEDGSAPAVQIAPREQNVREGRSPSEQKSDSAEQDTPAEAMSPGSVTSSGAEAVPEQKPEADDGARRSRASSAGALIAVLLALFGFTLVVQLRSNDGDQGLATARQEDLVRILSDLEARDSRLQSEIGALETSQRQLTSGVAGRQAALAEADKRADELGLLAGTLPGRGPGLVITVDKVKASAVLNAVQELRGAGGEVMQIAGAGGAAVRVVASSYFVDAEGGGIIADGQRLAGPYVLTVIGVPQTMQTALQIPGGVVASVNSGGGSVTMEQRTMVEVTAVRDATALRYARPAS